MFKPKTVDAAIAPLLKAVSDLENVSGILTDTISKNHSTITRLQAENTAHDAERIRAGTVLVALRGITNPKKD